MSATVALGDGTLHHSGGWLSIEDQAVRFTLVGAGQLGSEPLPGP